MFKNIIEDIRLAKLSYLLEIIEVRELPEKVKAFNKIKKMNLTKEMGIRIIETAGSIADNMKIESSFVVSLIGLCFNNFYDEYSITLNDMFHKLDEDSMYKILSLLAYTDNKCALILYSDLVVKYFKDKNDIPLGNLANKESNYYFLFPKLFKSFTYSKHRNNIFILLNDFVNQGIVQVSDLKRNKDVLRHEITKYFKEAINYKFAKNENFMANQDYVTLRLFLESAVNIEYYISSRETKKLLDKLYSKKDNQLKLFILENYIKKNRKIENINLNSIARDKLSRYPLYNLLMYYNLERYMPKKYKSSKSLAESDLYLNYAITYQYSEYPEDMKFYKQIIKHKYKYFVFKFKVKSLYQNVIKDYTTDYLINNSGLSKYKDCYVSNEFIGISGGYNKDVDPSLLEYNTRELMIKENKGNIEDIISSLLPKNIVPNIEIEDTNKIEEKVEEERKRKLRIFSFKTLFLFQFLIIIMLFSILISYIHGYNILNLDIKSKTKEQVTTYKKASYQDIKDFSEINGHDIFNKDESEYYVLFFQKKEASEYYTYVSYLVDNGYKFYYVDVTIEDNKFLYGNNELNFTITSDRLLKVNDGEYEFYVDGKTNILRELRNTAEIVRNKKAQEEIKNNET